MHSHYIKSFYKAYKRRSTHFKCFMQKAIKSVEWLVNLMPGRLGSSFREHPKPERIFAFNMFLKLARQGFRLINYKHYLFLLDEVHSCLLEHVCMSPRCQCLLLFSHYKVTQAWKGSQVLRVRCRIC